MQLGDTNAGTIADIQIVRLSTIPAVFIHVRDGDRRTAALSAGPPQGLKQLGKLRSALPPLMTVT